MYNGKGWLGNLGWTCKYTAISKKDNQQGPTKPAHGTLIATWMGGESGREWIHVYAWLSPLRCSSEIITTLLIRYTPIQTKSS